jgi:hypothetical protein
MTITAPAPTRAPTLKLVTHVLAIAIVLASTAVALVVLWQTRTVPTATTQTSAEQTYLHLMFPTDTDLPGGVQKAELKLGYAACRTMTSGTAGRAAYRTAVGGLMAEQVSPSWATLTVHNALVSGLCLQR